MLAHTSCKALDAVSELHCVVEVLPLPSLFLESAQMPCTNSNTVKSQQLELPRVTSSFGFAPLSRRYRTTSMEWAMLSGESVSFSDNAPVSMLELFPALTSEPRSISRRITYGKLGQAWTAAGTSSLRHHLRNDCKAISSPVSGSTTSIYLPAASRPKIGLMILRSAIVFSNSIRPVQSHEIKSQMSPFSSFRT